MWLSREGGGCELVVVHILLSLSFGGVKRVAGGRVGGEARTVERRDVLLLL